MDNQQLYLKGLAEGQTLRSYQLNGVSWLIECYDRGEGGLLCDEMGLGKTCQAICFLISVSSSQRPMSLVLCPLTVLDNWKQEFNRFAPKVKVVTYIGDQDMRSRLQKAVRKSAPDVLLTTYDMCLRDNFFFEKRIYNVVVVDEGHRLKNSESLLYKSMEDHNVLCRVLLTGTPVQNDLGEMYSLLSFVSPSTFELANKQDFVQTYKDVKTDERVATKLQNIIKPYVLRRTKAEVALDIPEKSEVLVYHPISDLQKKYYKAILTKDSDAFETENSVSKTKLLNILMQLRKCVNHPYLFDGVEPEPFQLGEHLVEASAKLVTLDKILHHLAMHNHKVLIFSQMTRVLDILQDYLHYRDYTYERLDGSVRGEERFTAVRNFNSSSETFVFLLSSRAGGQGLNLTAADTVIFYDHDFNPQVDLQAAARAHRIGQTRPVKIIRLVAKATVEEVILSRAEAKLRLTQSVMTKSADIDAENDLSSCVTKDLQKMLKYGLTSLLSPDSEEDELNVEEILGATDNSKWVVDRVSSDNKEELASSQQPNTIYQFEGKDYSKEQVAPADDEAFQRLVADARAANSDDETLRRRRTPAAISSLSLPDIRTRKPLTAEQLEERRKQRELTLQRKKEEAEAREKKKQAKKMERWRVAGYTSHSLLLPSDNEESEASDDGSDVEYMHFVSGDVTKPVKPKAIVIQCVDDSGEWGSGGVFTALSHQTKQPELYYELAGDMGDLKEGDVHMVNCDDITGYEEYKVALLLAQDGKLRVKQSLLATCLQKISHTCRGLKGVSVHLPRIGYNTVGFDWYSTERQLRKYLSNRRIHTYIYYYKRRSKRARTPSPTDSKRSRNDSPGCSVLSPGINDLSDEEDMANIPSTSASVAADISPGYAGVLLDLFTNINFHIDTSVDPVERKKLKRYIIAFDGNVEACETERTNFVVTAGDCDVSPDNASARVKPDFVFDCIADQRPLKL